MTYANPDALVSTDWLADHLTDPAVKVLDGTYHLPTAKRDADAEFLVSHIPGAVRFDIDDICDPDDPLPHMLPTPERFAEKVGALGVSNTDRVIVYDVYGMQSAARGWWMFRVFGHDNVAILNGGMAKWIAEGRPTEGGAGQLAPSTFEAGFRNWFAVETTCAAISRRKLSKSPTCGRQGVTPGQTRSRAKACGPGTFRAPIASVPATPRPDR